MWIRFHAELILENLAVPDPAEPVRTDGLWRTTCFEAFIRQSGEGRYAEFNLSPSHQWAAYSFEDYRNGMVEMKLDGALPIDLDVSADHFALETLIPLPPGSLEIALSAVIEETDGTKSYWALVHPPGQPDFHHPTCFALTLPAPAKE